VAQQVPAALESGGSARGQHFDRLAGSLGMALFEPGAVTLDGPGERLIVELPGLPEPLPLPGGFGFRLEGGSWLRLGAVIDGSPAAASGLQAGDAVQAIDDVDARAWSPAQAWQSLAGREQTALRLFRDDRSRRVELRRERFFPLLR
jgi:membrane-associated protease RseP (regulator of RpoE activity)